MPSTQTWLDSATLQKAIELMNKAIDTAKTETYKKRLLREKLSIDLVLLKERYYSLRRSAEFSGQKFCTFIDPQTFINDFFARCHEFNLHHLTTSIVEDSGAFKNSNSRAAMIHGNSSMW
ncbi:MAG: hypothetical protein LBU34_06250 [Planctomycetaceae bacterium]|jgi:hypothetical protein|nr:hypothetical protein [Planctomycetaceae bacterium]